MARRTKHVESVITSEEMYLCDHCKEITSHTVERAAEDDSDVLVCDVCEEPIGDMRGFDVRERDRAIWGIGQDTDTESELEDVIAHESESAPESNPNGEDKEPEPAEGSTEHINEIVSTSGDTGDASNS